MEVTSVSPQHGSVRNRLQVSFIIDYGNTLVDIGLEVLNITLKNSLVKNLNFMFSACFHTNNMEFGRFHLLFFLHHFF